MKKKILVACVMLFPIVLAPLMCVGQEYSVIVEKDVSVTMRDGVHIVLDVYRPDAPGKFPALYAVSPYGKDFDNLPAIGSFRFRETGPIEWYVQRGYVYVHADVRGTGKSREGEWRFLDETEQNDMYDTIEWIAAQPWSSGSVGMIGESYYGLVQYLAAEKNPPHLKTIVPYDAMADPYRDAGYHGGILCQGFPSWWHLDTRARTLLDTPGPHPPNVMRFDLIYFILSHPTDGPLYRERSAYAKFDKIKIPVYSIGNWNSHALHLRGNLTAFEEIKAPKKLLVNGGNPQEIFDSVAFHEHLIRWYDRWLKGIDTGIMDEPQVRVYVRGADTFRDADEWPLAGTAYTDYYLRTGPTGAVGSVNDGGLSTTAPGPDEKPDIFRYPDPNWFGWPGLGTGALVNGIPNAVKGILTYTTEPLERDTEVTGPIVLILYASSDRTDTDFCVRISDQDPDPRGLTRVVTKRLGLPPKATVLTRGWLKASHRELDEKRSKPYRPFHTHTNPEKLVPGTVYRFDIEIMPTANVFKKGHRIRLELAPGDSPVFDAPFDHYFSPRQGMDTIYHDDEHPSRLVLPVIPDTL
jgi:predicted acyl esterase